MSRKGDAYSVDLREKVLSTLENNGWTEDQTAAFFGIGSASIYRWKRLRRETGSVVPRPHGGGQPRKVTPQHDAVLRKLVDEKNDRTLAELQKGLEARTGLRASIAAIWDGLNRLGMSLKKKRSRRSSTTVRT